VKLHFPHFIKFCCKRVDLRHNLGVTTKNEKIADVIGWEYIPVSWDGRIETAKLLQQKMAHDGWVVIISQYPAGFYKDCGDFRAAGCRDDEECCGTPKLIHELYAKTEPAAIVSLFCRVYGIEE
jgi:hypothetical protein